jgi:hypothetical protein
LEMKSSRYVAQLNNRASPFDGAIGPKLTPSLGD